jgi:uncharacterized repeat protein (TIGR04138 family)
MSEQNLGKKSVNMKKKLEEIAKEDGRFGVGALKFVYEGLGYTAKKAATDPASTRSPLGEAEGSAEAKPNHVTGGALCEGLRKLAIEKWGRLAMLVLNRWNIKTTRDFGEIVYLMIKHGWLSVQPTDSIDDFNDVYDFKTAFKDLPA